MWFVMKSLKKVMQWIEKEALNGTARMKEIFNSGMICQLRKSEAYQTRDVSICDEIRVEGKL